MRYFTVILICISLISGDVEHLFMCIWPLVCLWINVYLDLMPTFWLGCLVFFFILSCLGYLYILEINPLSVASFASISSHSMGCVFLWFMVSSAVQKFLYLIISRLFIFAFIFITLSSGLKNIFLWFMSKSVLPMFSSIESSLTF